MLRFIISQFILVTLLSFANAWYKENQAMRGILTRLRKPPPPDIPHKEISAHYFRQLLDHFDTQNSNHWPQRYFSSYEFYEEGGPIFLEIGGEWELGGEEVYYGAWIEWAKREKAALFVLGHRYYDHGHPTPSLTTKELSWLSSKQALSDTANFIESHIQKTLNLTGPVITFGGSYPGSLVAWARQIYPHLIKGSVSSSGPLLAKVNFFEYLEVVYEALERDVSEEGYQTNTALKTAFEDLETMMDENRLEEIEDLFDLCGPLDKNSREDVARFFGVLAGILMGAVQYDPHGYITIQIIHNFMNNENYGSTVERLAALNDYSNGEYCTWISYQEVLDLLSSVEYDDVDGDRQWIYQTCTEFGWYQTSDQPGHPYSSKFPVDVKVKLCKDLFGDTFTPEYIESLVQETNAMYGGKNIDVDNVVFVHGSIDPWHAMGRLTDVNENSPAFVINGTSHCADTSSNQDDDSEELKNVRAIIGDLIHKWIEEAKNSQG